MTNFLSHHNECRLLAAEGFPVAFPGKKAYEDEQSRYWSARQADQHPRCRVTPDSPASVSTIMQYMHGADVDFSIVSGGHGTAEHASNFEHGVTFDLSDINSVTLSDDGSEVRIGTGTRWSEVYRILDLHNLTVAGARGGSVGVSGFLLGGGISHLATSHGWGCDSVVDIDMVLSNGTRLILNEQVLPEAFKAMKGAGSNIAIPLEFIMRTTPYQMFQAGLLRYEWDEMDVLLPEVTSIVETLDEDQSAFELSITYDGSKVMGFLMYTKFGEVDNDQQWQRFSRISRSPATVEATTPGRLADVSDRDNPRGYRCVASLCTTLS
jgi:FAD/FMN-containing dehydrogenase